MKIQPIFDDQKLWIVDQTDLKDASTLILLQDKNAAQVLDNANHRIDLELQRLIGEQFETEMALQIWAIQTVNQVRYKIILFKR